MDSLKKKLGSLSEANFFCEKFFLLKNRQNRIKSTKIKQNFQKIQKNNFASLTHPNFLKQSTPVRNLSTLNHATLFCLGINIIPSMI